MSIELSESSGPIDLFGGEIGLILDIGLPFALQGVQALVNPFLR